METLNSFVTLPFSVIESMQVEAAEYQALVTCYHIWRTFDLGPSEKPASLQNEHEPGIISQPSVLRFILS